MENPQQFWIKTVQDIKNGADAVVFAAILNARKELAIEKPPITLAVDLGIVPAIADHLEESTK